MCPRKHIFGQKVFPLPTVGALSASNSPSAIMRSHGPWLPPSLAQILPFQVELHLNQYTCTREKGQQERGEGHPSQRASPAVKSTRAERVRAAARLDAWCMRCPVQPQLHLSTSSSKYLSTRQSSSKYVDPREIWTNGTSCIRRCLDP